MEIKNFTVEMVVVGLLLWGAQACSFIGTPQKDIDQTTQFRKAAEQGNTKAQKILGSMYATGLGTEKNIEQARYWYFQAAAQGDLEAQKILGIMSYQANDECKDVQVWLPSLANKGDIDARKIIDKANALPISSAWVSRPGFSGEQTTETFMTCNALFTEYWLRKAATRGDADAQEMLGLIYKYDTFIGTDDKQARYWLQKADEQRTHPWFRNLFKRISSWSYRPSEIQADNLIKYRIACMYKESDIKHAEFLLNKLAQQGYLPAEKELRYLGLHSKDYVLDATWTRKLIDQGDISLESGLAVLYENGQGVEKNEEQATYWFRKAAEHGDSVAALNLAVRYAKGEGVAKDCTQADIWLNKMKKPKDYIERMRQIYNFSTLCDQLTDY